MDLAHLIRDTFNTYIVALRDEVMRNPGGRYSRVRKEEIEMLFRAPKPTPTPAPVPVAAPDSSKYRHMLAYIGEFNHLCNLTAPLPSSFTARMYAPDKESSSVLSGQSVVLVPTRRFVRPNGLGTIGDIVELNCVGKWPGESRQSEIRLTLYPYYRPLRAIVRRGQYDEAEQV